ncbi:MAG: MobC family plasmid mobilization relaxosome protein [Oscillospiraceae bacterium]|nr:MobC family plasmid mobilization relaxosome protein [Oscillospiraceae bacterium]
MAQPKKDADLVRQHRVAFRLSDVEYEIVKKRSESAGVGMSEYMRKALLGGKLTITHEIVAEFPDIREEMKKISFLLSNIANNINQIARYFNTGGLRSQAVTAELEKALDAVFKIHFDVVRMVDEVHGNLKARYK